MRILVFGVRYLWSLRDFVRRGYFVVARLFLI